MRKWIYRTTQFQSWWRLWRVKNCFLSIITVEYFNTSNFCSPHFKNNPDCTSDKVFLFEYINKGWITIWNWGTKMTVIRIVDFPKWPWTSRYSNPSIKKVKREDFWPVHIGMVQKLFFTINWLLSSWKLSTIMLIINVFWRTEKMRFVPIAVIAMIVNG